MTDVNIAITTGIGADALLFGYAGSTGKNYGTYNRMQLDNGRNGNLWGKELIRFDLSSIPSTATCTAAILKLTPVANETSDTYNVFKIADVNGDWIEGTKAGVAEAGSPCWDYKVYNTVGWAGSAGLSTAGTDYVNTVIATLTGSLTANTQCDITFNASGLAVLQSWFGDASNNGLLLVNTGNTDLREFHSKESATAGYRPVLAITYTDAPTGGTGLLIPNIFDSEILNSRIVR